MYAITFDLDTESLKNTYGSASWNNAYYDIKKALEPMGFTNIQGSVYFGDNTVNAVKCVLATIELKNKFSWFKNSVRDIRMLRIEEDNDLLPVL
jgi:virulence-associated protein VapD